MPASVRVNSATTTPSGLPHGGQTPDGTTIGHALHQFRETTDGFDALLAIYFPAAAPEEFIEGHRQHLAVEFTNWITGAAESLGRTSNSPVPLVVIGTEPYRS